MWGMHRAFRTLGSQGIADPQRLADSVHFSLIATALGTGLFAVGVVVMGVALLVYYRRVSPSVPPPLPGRVDPPVS